jgi:hypothetical protein
MPICDATSGQCVQCTADTDCSGTTPHCTNANRLGADTGAGRCVQCTMDAQCPQATPRCILDVCG